MASFDCPRCNANKQVKITIIDDRQEVKQRFVDCPQCLGTGHVDQYGKSKRF